MLEGQKCLVIGSGISGIGAVALLEKYHADVVLYDSSDKLTKEDLEAKLPGESKAVCIAGELPEMDKYDTVFLGFPIWWYVQPRIVDTFLEACDVSGKTIIPFATSGGSGVEGAARSLQKAYPQAQWKAGKLLGGGAAAWARSAIDG